MAESTESILETAISDAASGPLKATGDAGSFERDKISDLVAAHKYSKQLASAGTRRRGLRILKMIPGGTV